MWLEQGLYRTPGTLVRFFNYLSYPDAVILSPAHPASFAHNFVSVKQSFYFRESQDAIVLQTCD